MTFGCNQKVLIDSWVIQVVGDGSQKSTHGLHWGQVLFDFALLYETMHSLGYVGRVDRVVVRVGVVIACMSHSQNSSSGRH